LIAFIGLKNAGIVVDHPATLLTYGNLSHPPVALSLAGLALTAVLVARGVPGAIVLGILATAAAGLLVSNGSGATVTTLPSSWFSAPASPAPVFLKLEFGFLSDWSALQRALPLILTLLLVDMFDNIGTLIGVTQRAGLLDEHGELPKAGRALVADSSAAILSSLFGTSTVVSYVESASGVEAGGRTGLTSITTALLLLLSLVLTPVILAIPPAATAPALVIVGVFMLQSVVKIDMSDLHVAIPAAVTVIGVPLTFSIAHGIGLGLMAAALLALGTAQPRRLPLVGYVIAAVFFLEFFGIVPFHH